MPNFKAALAAYNTKDYQSAIKLIDKFCPLDFNANLLKAASLSALNKDAQAAEIYAELLNIKPGSTLLLESYTSLLLKLGDFEACLQLTSSPYLPASHQICLNKLEALIKSDKLMEAKKFISLLDIPEKLEFKFIWLKINLYESLGELEKIEKLISELPVNKAKNFYISYKRGCNLRSMGFFANALEILFKTKKDHKVTPEILYLIGCIYNDLNDSANCEYYLKQCLSIAPYYIPAHESLNKLYSANNNRRSFLSSYITVKQKYEPHPTLKPLFYIPAYKNR
ncbi:tetratricopeptide repeat protein [Pseudoalteromonas espejiana]